eukprot:4854758-Alexandrium_andersonii.AAC.1
MYPSAIRRSALRSPQAPSHSGSVGEIQVGFAETVEVRAFDPKAPPRAIHWSSVPKGGAGKRGSPAPTD